MRIGQFLLINHLKIPKYFFGDIVKYYKDIFAKLL
jgi:hypothetical protein